MLGIRKEETIEFVSKNDTGEVKTIFVLRNLTGREKLVYLEKLTDKTSTPEEIVKCIFEIVSKAVVKVKNFYDDGDEITDITIDFVDNNFDILLIYELNDQIAQMSKVDKETEKK